MTDLEQAYQMRGLAHLVFGGPGGTDPAEPQADPQPPAPGSTEDDTEDDEMREFARNIFRTTH